MPVSHISSSTRQLLNRKGRLVFNFYCNGLLRSTSQMLMLPVESISNFTWKLLLAASKAGLVIVNPSFLPSASLNSRSFKLIPSVKFGSSIGFVLFVPSGCCIIFMLGLVQLILAVTSSTAAPSKTSLYRGFLLIGFNPS